MDNIIQSLEEYLANNSIKSAFMICGPWGSGKTYYWDNFLKRVVMSKKIENENCVPIYISLYGVASVEEISNKILMGLINIKYSDRFKKSIPGGISTAIRVGSSVLGRVLDNFFINIKGEDVLNALNMKNIVYCFDDFERVSMPMKELLGFVNDIIEHQGKKVIILCNEGGIDGEDNLVYVRQKEKIIGITHQYSPDIEQASSAIIDEYREKIEVYNEIISRRKLIVDLFNRSETRNIRLLKQAVYYVYKIYEKSIAINKKYIDVAGDSFVRVILGLTFESKLQELDEGKKKNLKDVASNLQAIYLARMMSSKESEDNFITTYIDKYFSGNPSSVLPMGSLYYYIVENNFSNNLFMDDLNQILIVDDPEIRYKRLYKRLIYEFEMNELLEIVDDVLKKIDNNLIHDINEYELLYVRLSYYSINGIIDYTPDDIYKRFVRGVYAAFKNNIFQDAGDKRLHHRIATESVYNKEKFYKFIRRIQNKIDSMNISRHCSNALMELKKSYKDFESYITNREVVKFDHESVDILNYFDDSILYDALLSLNNRDAMDFKEYLRSRYYASNFAEFRFNEIEGMNNVLSVVGMVKNSIQDRIKKMIFGWTEQVLNSAIEGINAYRTQKDKNNSL